MSERDLRKSSRVSWTDLFVHWRVNSTSRRECADSSVPIFSDPAPKGFLILFPPSAHHHRHDMILPGLFVSPRLCVKGVLFKQNSPPPRLPLIQARRSHYTQLCRKSEPKEGPYQRLCSFYKQKKTNKNNNKETEPLQLRPGKGIDRSRQSQNWARGLVFSDMRTVRITRRNNMSLHVCMENQDG